MATVPRWLWRNIVICLCSQNCAFSGGCDPLTSEKNWLTSSPATLTLPQTVCSKVRQQHWSQHEQTSKWAQYENHKHEHVQHVDIRIIISPWKSILKGCWRGRNTLSFHMTSQQPCYFPKEILWAWGLMLCYLFSISFGPKRWILIMWVKTKNTCEKNRSCWLFFESPPSPFQYFLYPCFGLPAKISTFRNDDTLLDPACFAHPPQATIISTWAYEKHFPNLAQLFGFIPLVEPKADWCPDFILIVLVFRHLRFELMQANEGTNIYII